jgi:hypothetical protein
MAIDIEQELSEAFEAVGSVITPPPDLADRVRRRFRSRRRRVGGVVAVVALAVGSLGVVVAQHGVGGPPGKVTAGPKPKFRESTNNVEAMAVGGDTLYVAMNAYPKGLLTAYDRTTGAVVASANLPAGPTAITVAADGTVWVTFAPSNAGRRQGVTELSANLNHRTTFLTNDHYLDTATYDVLPLGDNRALLATDRGVVTVSLPRLGAARVLQASGTTASLVRWPGLRFGVPTQLLALPNGNVAVVLKSDGGQSRVILRDGAGEFTEAQMAVAASPEGVWATGGPTGSSLHLLSTSLSPLPAGAAATAAVLSSGVEDVWTSDRTVWAATERRRIRLSCFVFSDSSLEPSGAVTLPFEDSVEHSDPVVTGDVTVLPTPQTVYVASPYGITSYPVPAACRS